MSVGTPPELMTVDEFLDLPDHSNVKRLLINGELRELETTCRNPRSAAVLANVVFYLQRWYRSQSDLRGNVLVGDVGFRIQNDFESFITIAAVFVPKATPLYRHHDELIFDGPPLLAIEVPSPSDFLEIIEAKVDLYLAAQVPLVWIINPHHKTVTIFRPDAEPEMITESGTLLGEPQLPGLSISVRELFASDL